VIRATLVAATPVAQCTLRYARRMFAWAVAMNWIDKDPFYGIKNRSKRAIKKEHKKTGRSPIPDAVLKVLFARIAGDAFAFAFFYLLLFRGLRVSEALGLHWSNLDRDQRRLTIEHQATRLNRTHEGQTKMVKSEAGRRILTLGATAIALLDQLRATQRADGYHGEIMFPSKEGSIWNPHNFQSRYYASIRELVPEMQPYTPHWFRHTATDYMRNLSRDSKAMPPDMIADELGHDRAAAWMAAGGAGATAHYLHDSIEPREGWVAPMEARIAALLPRNPARVVPIRRAKRAS
jgi:integrase